MNPRTYTSFAALALTCLGVSAQVRWSQVPNPPGDYVTQKIVYDTARQRAVLIGHADQPTPDYPNGLVEVFEWDGTSWFEPKLILPPTGRTDFGLAYDPVRAVTTLVGGVRNNNWFGATFEWDGTNWTQPAGQLPVPRQAMAMAYDPVRNVTLVHGGRDGSGAMSDTLAWDGTSWTVVPTATSPTLSDHSMVWDSSRQRMVMFGGETNGFLNDDTWEWDGTDWTLRTTAVAPPARMNHSMTYDSVAQRTIVFGGWDGVSALVGGQWEWDGVTWTQRSPGTAPSTRAEAAMVYDPIRNNTVLFGGFGPGSARLADTWIWSGANWSERIKWPVGLVHAAVAYDEARDRLVLFGGTTRENMASGFSRETWEWDGSEWARLNPANSPSARIEHTMVYDAARGEILLFGGEDSLGTTLSDTWVWDGTNWTRRLPATIPPGRRRFAAAYDHDHQRVVMHGGQVQNNRNSADTWEWDGTDWSQPLGTIAASSRNHAMAYDEARGEMVLFRVNETWTYDGSSWTQRTTNPTPPNRSEHTMAYDRARQVVVLYGGATASTGVHRRDTWEWDGTSWSERLERPISGVRTGHGMVYDSARRRVLAIGGNRNSVANLGSSDMWSYAPDVPATWTTFGTGCGGPSGVPSLEADPTELPWLDETFTVELRNLPDGQPAFLFFGISNTSWGAVPLPLALDFLGLTGCAFWSSPDLSLPLVPTAGTASVSLPFSDPALIGGVYYNQGGALDPTANPGGIVFSNAACVTIGQK